MSVNSDSPFSDPEVFQHATFVFRAPTEQFNAVNPRGHRVTEGQEIEITFYLRPAGGGNQTPHQDENQLIESYTGIVVSGNLRFPKELQPGDSGSGEIRGRACIATIKSLAQSSVSPILVDGDQPAIGEKVTLEVSYRSRSGSHSNN
ncbi:MAG: hypothetical protein KME30_32020 [Iphinoe sp. HA4291-MV1]|jgi:hypothetical protein|nr:hypothetical protein [Iphinoe sp. HA4291-MV1]